MSDAATLVAQAHADLIRAGGAILLDLEFTCWKDSLRTKWADPGRPAEVIEIGLAHYTCATRRIGATFSALVRPHVNPTLSPYCMDLLQIAQEDVDTAEPFPVAVGGMSAWLRAVPTDGLATCGWGEGDRVRFAANTRMAGVADPFEGRPHIDLRRVMVALYQNRAANERDDLRALLGLPPNPRRHRALDDALDIAHFLALLFDHPRG